MDSNDSRDQLREKGGNGKGRIAIVICLVVIIALLAVVIILLLKRKEAAPAAPAEEQEKREVLVTEDNVDEIVERMMTGSTAPANYEATMNSTWTFSDGSQASDDAYVENSTSNQNDIYFDVKLKDTDEVIYESPVIPVGNHLDRIKLDKELEKGNHECILTYHLLDEDQNTVGTVMMAVDVIVEN